MRNLEIDSDKYTVLGIGLLFIFALWSAVASLLELISHRMHPQARNWTNYLLIAYGVYVVWTIFRDRNFRKPYPYGALAAFMFLASFVLRVVLRPEIRDVAGLLPSALELAGCSLGLVEIFRWFYARTKLI